MKNYFSTNLKYIREQKKLSKNKLGELVGVNQTTISRWENNIITPSIDNVIDVLNALNIPITELGTFLGKDLKLNNINTPPVEKKHEEYKKLLKEKGLMDNEENIDEEKLNKLLKITDMIDDIKDKG